MPSVLCLQRHHLQTWSLTPFNITYQQRHHLSAEMLLLVYKTNKTGIREWLKVNWYLWLSWFLPFLFLVLVFKVVLVIMAIICIKCFLNIGQNMGCSLLNPKPICQNLIQHKISNIAACTWYSQDKMNRNIANCLKELITRQLFLIHRQLSI